MRWATFSLAKDKVVGRTMCFSGKNGAQCITILTPSKVEILTLTYNVV